MRADKDDHAQECFSALQLIESNPVIWASIGCIYERKCDENIDEDNEGDIEGNITTQQQQQQKQQQQKQQQQIEKKKIGRNNLISAEDSFIASIEIAKPSEALLGTALTWLKTHKNILKLIKRTYGGAEYEQTLIEIRHNVEGPLIRYLQRRPVHALAWVHLAWSLEVRASEREREN